MRRLPQQPSLKRYGRQHLAVNDLTLSVPYGSVFAFLGKNGAGKTTTIRMLLHLLDKTSGQAQVLGMDSVRQALEIKRRVGYVADGQAMYDWMSVAEQIWFCKGFYPGWDDAFVEDLRHRLELPEKSKVRQLSRGEQAKLALLLAMAHHPELLILDEPTTGLDVVVRRNFLEGIIELIQEEGRTIFFSSHIVHEVERVADWVGIIDQGRLIRCAPIEGLKAEVKRIVLTFADPPSSLTCIPNILQVESRDRQSTVIVSDYTDETLAAVRAMHPTSIDVQDMCLEDIFVALVDHTEE